QVIVAYPWRRRTASEAFGRETARLFDEVLRDPSSAESLVAEAARRLGAIEPGPGPSVTVPAISVIAVTGTNGKTTTVRLLTHLVRTAGMTVAYSSTDGVYVNGEQAEPGDYSGFEGASKALSQPGVEAAVLE